MAPIPCAHCGVNFMPHDPDSDTIKICNNCTIKDRMRSKKEPPGKQKMQITVQFSKENVGKIEEYCLSENMSFEELFLKSLNMYFDFLKEQTDERTLVDRHEAVKRKPGRPKNENNL